MQASTVGLVPAPTLLHLTLRIGRIIEYRPGSALSLSLSYARYDILYILLVYGGLTPTSIPSLVAILVPVRFVDSESLSASRRASLLTV